MTTKLEDRVDICPMETEPPQELKESWFYLRFLHLEWLKRNPKVECSCREL